MGENGKPLGTVLIAGDDGESREVLEHMLRSQGYRVLAALDGAEKGSAEQAPPSIHHEKYVL